MFPQRVEVNVENKLLEKAKQQKETPSNKNKNRSPKKNKKGDAGKL